MISTNDFFLSTNQMDIFWHFLAQTRDLPVNQRIQIFKENILEPNLQYYACVFGINDAGIGHYIQESEHNFEAIVSGQASAIHRFHNCLKKFQDQFPAFQSDFQLRLLPSLGLFKGMTVPIQGRVWLLLGIDGWVGLSDNQFNGYITHELFHAYHYQRSPAVKVAAELAMRTMQMPPLWGLLWTEGIACLAVRMVHPDIPEEEILDWRLLVNQTKPLLPELAAEARKVLTSALPQDIAGFFYFPRKNTLKFPTGCGYYLGMLAAGMLVKKQPIHRLLELSDEAMVHEMDTALMEIEFNSCKSCSSLFDYTKEKK